MNNRRPDERSGSIARAVWQPGAASAVMLIALGLSACDDGATVVDPPPEGNDTDTEGGGAADAPLYAMLVVVRTADGATSYVQLSDSIDVSTVSLTEAREFPGFVSIAALGGALYVSHPEEPRLTRYEIGDDRVWREDGSISFSNRGVADAGFWNQFFVNENTAYAGLDLTKRVVWDPMSMTIRGTMEDSAISLESQNGLVLTAANNRQPWFPSGPAIRLFYHRDADWLEFAPNTLMAVYDRETHVEQAVVELPCPGLEHASPDENGRVYLSTWNVVPTAALYGLGPAPCVTRVNADGTLDATWTADLRSWTGGRHITVFRYMSEGKALGAVFHDEELGADFSTGFDEAVAEEISGGSHYRMWLFDMVNETARPIEGMEGFSGYYHGANFDGRTFVFLPYDGNARTKVYEVDTSGVARQALDATGWVYEWQRIR